MPNSASAKKSLRQSLSRRERNRSQRSSLRTIIKKFLAAVDSGELQTAETAFRLAVKRVDQAAAKNLLHKNKAARTKSRLSTRLKKLQSAS